MVKQTVAKEEAERRISERLNQMHPDASRVSLMRADGGGWHCVLDAEDVDAHIVADAAALLRALLETCDVAEMPKQSFPVEELDAGNDE